MTPSNIDRNIVEMRFDNTQFESNVKESLKTIAKLKQELEFGDVSKGFDELEKTGKHFSANFVVDMRDAGNAVDEISNKFSTLQVMGVTALANLTNQAVNYGKKIAKSLTIDPIMQGKGKYESYLRSVQTMLFQDDSLSESKVAEEMEKILEYVDQTSYGFGDLTKVISQFTAHGIELGRAVNMAIGIGNWGGLSGKGVTELGSAFYNIPQMIGEGYVKHIDWKSINLTGMAIKQVKEEMIDMAIESGRLSKAGEHVGVTAKGTTVDFKNFDTTLRDLWFDAELMEDFLVKMADRTEGLGKKGFLASQRALGLADALNAIKDAASTGWLNSFTLIFGMVDGAARIFTDFADAVMTVISLDAEFRNSILGKWLNTGEIWDDRNDRDNFLIGHFDVNRDRMRDTASNLWYGFTEIKKAIENGLDISFTGVGRHFGEDEANYVAEQYALFLSNVTDKINAASLKFRSWLTGQDYTQEQYIIEGIDDVVSEFDEAGYDKAMVDLMTRFYGDKKIQKAMDAFNKKWGYKSGESGSLYGNGSKNGDYSGFHYVYETLKKEYPGLAKYIEETYGLLDKENFTTYLNDAGNVAKQVEESGKDVQLFGYFWRDWTKILADGKTPLESITDLVASLGNVLQIAGKAIHVVAAPVTSFLDRIMRPGGIVSTILSDISTSLLWITDTVKNSGILDLLGGFFEKVGGFIGFLIEAGFFTIRDTLRNLFVGIPSAISEGLNKLKTFLFGEKGDWVEYEFGFTFNPDKKKTEGAIDKVIKWAKETWNKIKGPLGNISQVIGAFSTSVGSSFGNLWAAIQETFGMDTSGVEGGFFERLSVRLQPLRDYFANLWPNLKQTFITELEKINPDLAKSLRELYHNIKNTVLETWNNITTTVTSILNGTFDWEEAGKNALATLETWKTWLGGKLTEFRNWLFEQFPFLRDAYNKLHAFLFGEDIVETTAPEKHVKGGRYLAQSFTSVTHKNGLIDNIREWFDIPEEEEERTPLQHFFAGISGGIQDGIDWIGQKLPFLEGVFNKLKTLIFGGWEPYTTATGVETKTYRKGWSEYIREWASGAWDWFTVPEATGEGEEGEKKTGLQTFIGEVGEWIDEQLHGKDGQSGIIGKLTEFKTNVENFVQPVTNWFTVPNADNKTGFQIFLDGVVSWFEALPGRIGTAVETVKQAFHNAKVWLFGEDIITDVIPGQEKRVKGGKYLTPYVLVTEHKDGFFDKLGKLGEKAKKLFGEGAEDYSKWQTEDGSVFGFFRFVWEEAHKISELFSGDGEGFDLFKPIKDFFRRIGGQFSGESGDGTGVLDTVNEVQETISKATGFNFGSLIEGIFVSTANAEDFDPKDAISQGFGPISNLAANAATAAKEATEKKPTAESKATTGEQQVFGPFAWVVNLFKKIRFWGENFHVFLDNYDLTTTLERISSSLEKLANAYLLFNAGRAMNRLTGGFSLNSIFGETGLFGKNGLLGSLFGGGIGATVLQIGAGLAMFGWALNSLLTTVENIDDEKIEKIKDLIGNILGKLGELFGTGAATNLVGGGLNLAANIFMAKNNKGLIGTAMTLGQNAPETIKAIGAANPKSNPFSGTSFEGLGNVLFGLGIFMIALNGLFSSFDFTDENTPKKIEEVKKFITDIFDKLKELLVALAAKDVITNGFEVAEDVLGGKAAQKLGVDPLNPGSGKDAKSSSSSIMNIGIGILAIAAAVWILVQSFSAIHELVKSFKKKDIKIDKDGNAVQEEYYDAAEIIGSLIAGAVTFLMTIVGAKALKDKGNVATDINPLSSVFSGLREILTVKEIDWLADTAIRFLDAVRGRDMGEVVSGLIGISVFLVAASASMRLLQGNPKVPSKSFLGSMKSFFTNLVEVGVVAAVITLVTYLMGKIDELGGGDFIQNLIRGGDAMEALGSALGHLLGGLVRGFLNLDTKENALVKTVDDLKEIRDYMEKSGFTIDDVMAMTPLIELLAKLAEAKSKIPDSNGLLSFLTGFNQDFASLSDQLYEFVKNMHKNFGISVGWLKTTLNDIDFESLDIIMKFLDRLVKIVSLMTIVNSLYQDASSFNMAVDSLVSNLIVGSLDALKNDDVKAKLQEVLNASYDTGGNLTTDLHINVVFDMDAANAQTYGKLATMIGTTGTQATARAALRFEQSNQIDYSDYLSSIESKLDILGADMANLKIYINSHALVGQIAPELSRRFAQQYAMVGGRP